MDIEEHFQSGDKVKISSELTNFPRFSTVVKTWDVPLILQPLTAHHQMVKVKDKWLSGYWVKKYL